jgi:hypothetical protein
MYIAYNVTYPNILAVIKKKELKCSLPPQKRILRLSTGGSCLYS